MEASLLGEVGSPPAVHCYPTSPEGYWLTALKLLLKSAHSGLHCIASHDWISRQIKEGVTGSNGKRMERFQKRISEKFPRIFCSFRFQNQPIKMHTSLLLKAFEKAESVIQSRKPTRLAQHLSDYIQEQSGEPFGEKSLRNHYTAAKKGNPIDLKTFVANALSTYLGFENLETFIQAHPTVPKQKKPFYMRYKWPIAGLLVVLVMVFGYHQLTKERWMVWQEDHYMEVPLDKKLLQEGTLKLYNEDRITNFKKIDPDCNTTYKTADGKALVWYGKNSTGDQEYFTTPGLHPETGKTLKELSAYMFEKYICPK